MVVGVAKSDIEDVPSKELGRVFVGGVAVLSHRLQPADLRDGSAECGDASSRTQALHPKSMQPGPASLTVETRHEQTIALPANGLCHPETEPASNLPIGGLSLEDEEIVRRLAARELDQEAGLGELISKNSVRVPAT